MALAIAHAHSTWSYDGELTLQEWQRLASGRVDAVLLTEHEEGGRDGWSPDRYAEYVASCAQVSTEDLSLIPGIEFNQDGYHVLCYGLREWPGRPCSIEALASAVHAQERLLCLAHPVRYEWRYPSRLLGSTDAIEVWNSHWVNEGGFGPHPRSLRLARGKAMFVGQDVHKPAHLSRLYLRTESRDVPGDLNRGAYAVEFDGRTLAARELTGGVMRGLVQRCRTRVVRSGLRSYRWTRNNLHRTQVGRVVWEAASAVATPVIRPWR